MNSREREYLKYSLAQEKHALNELKKIYQTALNDINDKIALLQGRTDMENLSSIIYQLDYQKALKKQVGAILDDLHAKEYDTIQDYLNSAYEDGFIGTMYNLHGQGIPLVFPIDQEQVLNALTIDSKLSKTLYESLGEDITLLKRKVASEISRGISNNYSFADISRNVSNISNTGLNNAYRIARTEGHRIQNQSIMDAAFKAKEKGADIVKQWDSTLDSRTRPHHTQLDGQIKELDEPFEVAGLKAMHPSGFGIASEDIHCRCVVLQRARWAIEDEQGSTKWDNETGELITIDSKNYQDFKNKYYEALTNNVDDNNYIKISNVKVKKTTQKFDFPDGGNGTHKTANAVIFETQEGVKFVFPEEYSSKNQTMTPEKAIELWQKVPDEIKKQAQKEIIFVDYYNPYDSYWKKKYKNFSHSYATGGKQITFYKFTRKHDDSYVIRTYIHEAAHYIDMNLGGNNRFSYGKIWNDAIQSDKIISGINSPTKYGNNSVVEDFAESIAEYFADPKEFKEKFPNRWQVISDMVDKKGGT